jgi:putative membrane protein
MVVRRSSGIDHVAPITALLGAWLWALGLAVLVHFSASESLIVIFSLICLIAPFFLARLSFTQRLFTSKRDQFIQVHLRAEAEFHRRGLHKTSGGTGVLLFLSALERKAVVLADHSIASRLKPEVWSDVLSALTNGLKTEGAGMGFVRAIEITGKLLGEHFPPVLDKVNEDELSNHLIIVE